MYKSVVSRTIANYKSRGTVKTLEKSGCPRKTSKGLDRRIKRLFQANPFTTAKAVVADLSIVNVSTKTINRRLRENELFARRPAKKHWISKKNRAARIAFAKRHLHWT